MMKLLSIHIYTSIVLGIIVLIEPKTVLGFSTVLSLPHLHHRSTRASLSSLSSVSSLSSSSDSSTEVDPPLITFHRNTPLHSSTYNQVLSTNTLQPIATKLRQSYDDHFRDPRQPNAERFKWDPWYVSIGDGTKNDHDINNVHDDDDDDDESTDTLDGEHESTSSQTQYSLKRIQTSTFFTTTTKEQEQDDGPTD